MSAATERLRVLVVGHTYVVGVNQTKLTALAARGDVDVGLLVPSGWRSSDWQRRFILDRPDSAIRCYPADVLFEGRGGAYMYPPRTIVRALRGFRPHLVHVEQEVFALSAFELAVACRLARLPLSVFCWENVDRPLSLVRRWTRSVVLRTARTIIAGNSDAAHLLRTWGYAGPVAVLPQLGVDTCLFRPRPKPDGGSLFTVGFVGRLVHAKGVDVLLEAVHRLVRAGCTCRAVICGAGPAKDELTDASRRLGLDQHVVWTAALPHDRVPDLLAKLDVLVLPSRTTPLWKEQFGHVLIEAMAMGIPVIGSSSGEIPHVLGRSDLIFPEGDAAALAAILERMAQDPAWRREVGEYGLQRVREHYTQERIAGRMMDVWRSVVHTREEGNSHG